ncbi:MAG: DNA methyltransferase, partial [Hydrogenobacter sp.]
MSWHANILHGNALEVLRHLPENLYDCVITSPPYYKLRVYGTPTVWENKWYYCEGRKHEWDERGFCKHCPAWVGELGQEPDVELYINHLADIFDGVKRTLKRAGNCFIVIGETYKDKQMLLVPYRLAMALQNRGWIVRDIIIWAKKIGFVSKDGIVRKQYGNGLPESVKDRLTKNYEVIIHAVKSENYYFNKPKTKIKEASLQRYLRGHVLSKKYMGKNMGASALGRKSPNFNLSKYLSIDTVNAVKTG